MCFTRNLKTVGALLIATACLSPTASPGANHPKPSPFYPSKGVNKSIGTGYRQSHENNMMRRTNEARVLSKTKAKNLPSRIRIVPTATVYSASSAQPAKKLSAARRSAKTVQVTPTKLSKVKNAKLRTSNSDTPSTSIPEGRSGKSKALKPTIAANASGLSSVRPKVSGLEDVAQRAGRIRTKVSDQVGRDLNSSSAAAIGNAMPGFADRGSEGCERSKGHGEHWW